MSNKRNIANGITTSHLDKSEQLTSQLPNGLPLLLKRKEVADLLNIGLKTVPQFLSAHGILPIDLGRGRGRGLRWATEKVISVPGILHTEAQAEAPQPKAKKTPQKFSVRGKTADQLFAEFNEDIETRVEVRNGN